MLVLVILLIKKNSQRGWNLGKNYLLVQMFASLVNMINLKFSILISGVIRNKNYLVDSLDARLIRENFLVKCKLSWKAMKSGQGRNSRTFRLMIRFRYFILFW